jgi:hypothetical protein
MGRSFDINSDERAGASPPTRTVDHSTARAFAAALSALAISSLVVTTSAGALEPDGTVATNRLAAGSVSITDDDGGHSLVELDNMAPGRPHEQCINVVYDGTIVPVTLTLSVRSNGELADFVMTDIERGSGGEYGDCDDFEPEERIFDGTLSDLGARDEMPLGSLRNRGESTSFRFVFELADEQAALGLTTATDFIWEVTPE